MNLLPRSRLSAMVTLLALFGSLAVATSASAEPAPDAVAEVLAVVSQEPDSATPVVSGPFDLAVQVSGGGAEDITLTPTLPFWSWSYPSAQSKTVPGGSCVEGCVVTWRIDPANQASPWLEGSLRVGVQGTVGDRSMVTYGTGLYYRAAVRTSWAKNLVADVTPNTTGYADYVVDTGGDVTFEGTLGRSPGEQVVVSVLPAADYTSESHRLDLDPLARAIGTWGSDPDTGFASGTIHLDTSTIPEGNYRLIAQARDQGGHYSFVSPRGITVRHDPSVYLEPGARLIAAGQSGSVKVHVRKPTATKNAPGAVRLTVGGKSTLLADDASWYVSTKADVTSQRVIDVPTQGLPLGPAPVSIEVLDTAGVTIGTGTTTLEVVDFHDSVTIPTLVVGRPVWLQLRATAPPGTTLMECSLTVHTPLGAMASHNMCPGPNATIVDGRMYYTPGDAGKGTLEQRIAAHNDVIGPERTFPVTVYANRTATLSAPSRATYNTTQSATVTVQDEKKLGAKSSAGSGVTVSVQRKKAGTTAWTTIGTANTNSSGVAMIKYTNSSSGRLRAVVKGAVPATTVTTAERTITSVATVAWSSLPTSARSGTSVTAAVYAKPYEKGSTIRLQARKLGTSTWTTLGSGTVASNGYAKAPGRLYTRTTWEVRVQRAATTTQSAGYSTARRIKIT